MKEPSKKAIAQVKNKELVRIAEMHKVSVDIVSMVSDKVNSILPAIAKSKNAEKYYAEIEKYMVKNYGALYSQYKDMIVNSLNESGIEQKHLLDLTLGEPTIAAFPIYKTLPSSEAFKITNKILSEKSILKRSSVLAKRTTSIIAKSFDKGLSLPEITKKLDIEYGLRDKAGKITPANLQKIKEGKLVLRNGTIYQNERIARTECLRMSRIQTKNVFDSIDRDDKRLKYQGNFDKRARPNSKSMHGQISTKEGKFKFPDGNYYFMYSSPARYSVNCRCSASIIFIED